MDNIFTGRHKNLTILAIVLTVQFFGLAAQIRRPIGSGASAIATLPHLGRHGHHRLSKNSSSIPPRGSTIPSAATSICAEFGRRTQSLTQQVEDAFRSRCDSRKTRSRPPLCSRCSGSRSSSSPKPSRTSYRHQWQRRLARHLHRQRYLRRRERQHGRRYAGRIVGKVAKAFHCSSQVLLISDQSWGAGGILAQSRLQGIVKGHAGRRDADDLHHV